MKILCGGFVPSQLPAGKLCTCRRAKVCHFAFSRNRKLVFDCHPFATTERISPQLEVAFVRRLDTQGGGEGRRGEGGKRGEGVILNKWAGAGTAWDDMGRF